MPRILMASLALGALIALAGCQVRVPFSTAPDRDNGTRLEQLSGTVTYRQRIALPDDPILTVRLIEVGADQIAVARVASQGRQVPLPFTLDYDPARIVAERRYALEAEISDAAGARLWTTASPFILSFAGEPIMLLLVPAPQERPPAP